MRIIQQYLVITQTDIEAIIASFVFIMCCLYFIYTLERRANKKYQNIEIPDTSLTHAL